MHSLIHSHSHLSSTWAEACPTPKHHLLSFLYTFIVFPLPLHSFGHLSFHLVLPMFHCCLLGHDTISSALIPSLDSSSLLSPTFVESPLSSPQSIPIGLTLPMMPTMSCLKILHLLIFWHPHLHHCLNRLVVTTYSFRASSPAYGEVK